MYNQKKWNIYIMANDHKIYLRKGMTTMEAIKWLEDNCITKNTDYFMHGTGIQAFCESK